MNDLYTLSSKHYTAYDKAFVKYHPTVNKYYAKISTDVHCHLVLSINLITSQQATGNFITTSASIGRKTAVKIKHII